MDAAQAAGPVQPLRSTSSVTSVAGALDRRSCQQTRRFAAHRLHQQVCESIQLPQGGPVTCQPGDPKRRRRANGRRRTRGRWAFVLLPGELPEGAAMDPGRAASLPDLQHSLWQRHEGAAAARILLRVLPQGVLGEAPAGGGAAATAQPGARRVLPLWHRHVQAAAAAQGPANSARAAQGLGVLRELQKGAWAAAPAKDRRGPQGGRPVAGRPPRARSRGWRRVQPVQLSHALHGLPSGGDGCSAQAAAEEVAGEARRGLARHPGHVCRQGCDRRQIGEGSICGRVPRESPFRVLGF
mmetsp:Transcript_21823/g.60625  ORF Transcript_21823/g.60625 Transcript_21823/m.60625 type:complete len:297 (+) Transcript_21823:1577-2467(+)